MKQILKMKFIDFWPDFNHENNFLINLLKKYYEVHLSNEPDLIFYSNFGSDHLKYMCKKIFYTGENIKPNFNDCDYAFSFEDNSKLNFHLPHFVEYEHFLIIKIEK